eukprot:CAMPEP_0179021506 /NCGR_PEP_ID=MMETSP0796-20121207/5927_1 /TAXON_ID=73915 /ORGANISM="Pyrodinium bahamense, Strain pbaha01" /LENGTH=47 /DNA_ID= /DNA_START= /DNA_END= /DNA_ORIENTATION=
MKGLLNIAGRMYSVKSSVDMQQFGGICACSLRMQLQLSPWITQGGLP